MSISLPLNSTDVSHVSKEVSRMITHGLHMVCT